MSIACAQLLPAPAAAWLVAVNDQRNTTTPPSAPHAATRRLSGAKVAITAMSTVAPYRATR